MSVYLIIAIFSISIFFLITIFKGIIRSRLLSILSSDQTFWLLMVISVLTWLIAIGGIGIYFFNEPKMKTEYTIKDVTDEIDFSNWKPVTEDNQFPECKNLNSVVNRRRTLKILASEILMTDFKDRHGTTGCQPNCSVLYGDVSINPCKPILERTEYELTLTVAKEIFNKKKSYDISYELGYCNAYRTPKDNWVSKKMRYQTKNYTFKLRFPRNKPWLKCRVTLEEPNSSDAIILEEKSNNQLSPEYEYTTPKEKILSVGTKLTVYFLWEPITLKQQNFN